MKVFKTVTQSPVFALWCVVLLLGFYHLSQYAAPLVGLPGPARVFQPVYLGQ